MVLPKPSSSSTPAPAASAAARARRTRVGYATAAAIAGAAFAIAAAATRTTQNVMNAKLSEASARAGRHRVVSPSEQRIYGDGVKSIKTSLATRRRRRGAAAAARARGGEAATAEEGVQAEDESVGSARATMGTDDDGAFREDVDVDEDSYEEDYEQDDAAEKKAWGDMLRER